MILCNQCGNSLEAESSHCSVCGAQAAANKSLGTENVNTNLRSLPSARLPAPSVEAASTSRSPIPMYIVIALLALIAGGGIVALLRPNKVETVASTSNASSPLPSNESSGDKKAKSEQAISGNQSVSSPVAPISRPSSGTWFVVLGSFPKNDREKANQRLQSVQGSGYSASIIDSDNYPGLRGGLWVVVMGPYSKAYAKSVADQIRVARPDAYIKSGW